MAHDFGGLVRADHDDLDHGLRAMLDERTVEKELVGLLEVFRLALAVHAVAEAIVFRSLLVRLKHPSILEMMFCQAADEHLVQYNAAEQLSLVRPASLEWYRRVLELRARVLDHASRAELVRWTLQDHVSLPAHHALASQYATERLRVLARTSPLAVAQRQRSADAPGLLGTGWG